MQGYYIHNNVSVAIYCDYYSSDASSLLLPHLDDDDDDDDVISAYYRQTCNSPGRILYTVSCYNCSYCIHVFLQPIIKV